MSSGTYEQLISGLLSLQIQFAALVWPQQVHTVTHQRAAGQPDAAGRLRRAMLENVRRAKAFDGEPVMRTAGRVRTLGLHALCFSC